MPDPAWPSSPPEANYLRLVGTGAAGTATTLASAAAWEALMVANEMAFSLSTLNTAVTAPDFEGMGGAASAATVGGLNGALQLLAGWVQAKPPVAVSAVSAYETAVSAMVPAEVSLANRAEQAANVAINPLVLGALTPAIVALDLEYFGEHWPHNASAGAAYGSALTALLPALAVPPPLAPPGASPAAPAAAAAAVAETTGQAAAGEAMKESAQAAKLAGDGTAAPADAIGQVGKLAASTVQPLQSAIQPLEGMFQAPVRALQSLSSLPVPLESSELIGDAMNTDLAASAAVGGAVGISGTGTLGASPGGGAGAVAGTGVVQGAGLTTFTRPNSSFELETRGRPVGLKTGLLSASETRGPTTTAVPVPPPQAGMVGTGKQRTGKHDTERARVVHSDGHRPENSAS